MKPVLFDFVRIFVNMYFGEEPPAGLTWWLLVRPQRELERRHYAAWYEAVVDGMPVAVAGK